MHQRNKPLDAARGCRECALTQETIGRWQHPYRDSFLAYLVGFPLWLSAIAIIITMLAQAVRSDADIVELTWSNAGLLGLALAVSFVGCVFAFRNDRLSMPWHLYHFTLQRDDHLEYHVHSANPMSKEALLRLDAYTDATHVIRIGFTFPTFAVLRYGPGREPPKWRVHVRNPATVDVRDEDGYIVTMAPFNVLRHLVRNNFSVVGIVCGHLCWGAEIEEHERVKEARATLASGLRVVEALTGPDRSLNIVGRNAGGALVNEFVRLTFAEHGGIDPKLETEAIERAKKIAEHFKARRAKSAS